MESIVRVTVWLCETCFHLLKHHERLLLGNLTPVTCENCGAKVESGLCVWARSHTDLTPIGSSE